VDCGKKLSDIGAAIMAVAILGLAAYPKDVVWRNVELLVRSARRRAPHTRIAFLTAPLGDQDRGFFERFGVDAIECVEAPPRRGPDRQATIARRQAWILELYGRRHALYRQAIERRQESHFLLTDTRDVIVTAPLEGHASAQQLVLSQEDARKPIAEDSWNRDWVVAGYGEEGLAAIGCNPILCAGTVFGPRKAVDAYLAAMSAEVQRIGAEMTRRIGDQPLHNYLAYTGKLPHFEISTAEAGWMRSIGVMPFDTVTMDWESHDSKPTEKRCAVLHQYDRHLSNRQMRRAVAHVAGLPSRHWWKFDAYQRYGNGLIPRLLRPTLHVVNVLKRRTIGRKDN
jgi:hypothetical protein